MRIVNSDNDDDDRYNCSDYTPFCCCLLLSNIACHCSREGVVEVFVDVACFCTVIVAVPVLVVSGRESQFLQQGGVNRRVGM